MIINLLNLLIEALKHNFKQWSKNIALSLIPNLSDKNQIFRNEIQICFDKWVQYVGFETLIIHFPPFLKNENVDMRNEILDFIKKNENKFNKEIGSLVFKEMENNLLLCLQDKNINIKNKSEDMIKFSNQYVSLNNYYEKIKLYKPAISNDLKLILDKIQNDINGNNMNKNDINTNKKKEDDEYDIDNEGNININEIMNSNSKSNSKNGNGGSDIIPQKNKHKRENSGFLKSNSSILGRSSITNSERESINSSNGNMKYKKIINKNKSKNIKINNSINFLNKSKTINNKEQEVIKTAKSKDLSTSRKYPLTNYCISEHDCRYRFYSGNNSQVAVNRLALGERGKVDHVDLLIGEVAAEEIAGLELDAVVGIDGSYFGHSLCKGNVDGLSVVKSQVELVGNFLHGAFFDTFSFV